MVFWSYPVAFPISTIVTGSFRARQTSCKQRYDAGESVFWTRAGTVRKESEVLYAIR